MTLQKLCRSLILSCTPIVIFCAGKNVTSIEKDLTEDMAKIKTYFDDNKLVINMNVGKTEVIFFDTAKRTSMQPRPLKVFYNQQQMLHPPWTHH